MPFDGSNFSPGGDDPQRLPPRPTRATIIVMYLMVVLVVAPLSMTAVLDVLKYVRSGTWLSQDGSSWPGAPRPLTRWPPPKA